MKLSKEVDKAVDWASELGDQWVGTMIGQVLDNERDTLLRIVKSNNMELASVAVLNLMHTCMYAEKQLKEVEELSV